MFHIVGALLVTLLERIDAADMARASAGLQSSG
jgi:hypothetical protein